MVVPSDQVVLLDEDVLNNIVERRRKSHHEKRSVLSKDPKWSSAASAWESMQGCDTGHVFFEHIDIAEDGGMSEIGVKEDLWYGSRYLSSTILVFFVVYNVVFILESNFKALKRSSKDALHSDYLLSKTALQMCGFVELAENPAKIIAVLEIVVMCLVIAQAMWNGVRAVVLDAHGKWLSCAHFFWNNLPDLSIFSAIKILQFVSPQQASYDLNHILWYDFSYLKLVFFFISRPLMLCAGLDCFLVKVRVAKIYIMGVPEPNFSCVMGAILLLNQILGVVQINKTIKKRLYRFVFGGEDGILTDVEKVRMETWEAMVTQRIFKMYSPLKATAMMMSWCDDDFQMLALNEKELV